MSEREPRNPFYLLLLLASLLFVATALAYGVVQCSRKRRPLPVSRRPRRRSARRCAPTAGSGY